MVVAEKERSVTLAFVTCSVSKITTFLHMIPQMSNFSSNYNGSLNGSLKDMLPCFDLMEDFEEGVKVYEFW